MEAAGWHGEDFLTTSARDSAMRRAAARSHAMTQMEMEYSPTEKTQRIYARVAGFLFLWLIITGLAGDLTISHIVGSGTFAETAKRVVASEHLYRVALSSELIETLSAVLLAFGLYVTLKPVDKLLAQIAMYWRLGESFIGGVGMIFGFVRLSLYSWIHPQDPVGIRRICLGRGDVHLFCQSDLS
jgi:hypothetical protein